ncbi:MAG: hypothetical protein A6F70_02615 [Cycloclasticus sp. symbiont of Bathymodiolus heckerae]|nr:MAG: hypothetical protein A6F70_02615 [Cycloclasticus sp. symbiont of Bathymodiolus heckerae]
MKCNEFEFEYTVAPNEIAGDACEHLQICAQCQIFVEQESTFESQLAEVVNGATPEGLRQSLREHVRQEEKGAWRWPKASMALAASLLLAVGLVNINFTQEQSQVTQLPIDQLVVEHFSHDGAHSMEVSHQLDPRQLLKVSDQFGVRVTLGEHISFAEKCPIGDSYGLHMVYQYKGEPITIIYMPEVTLNKILPFQYAGLKGWIKPLETGSIAVLGGATIDLPEEELAEKAIEWL